MTGGIFIDVENMPVDIVLIRASEIPSRVADYNSIFAAGITGSDILRESRLGKGLGEELPIYDFNPDAKRSSLYIGATQAFCDYIRTAYSRNPEVMDLNGKKVATKYKNIAREVFEERGLSVEIIAAGGKIEAMQYAYPDCNGLVEVRSSGETAIANNIDVIEIFEEVTIQMIQAENKLRRRDKDVLDDIRERIEVARQRRRMI